MEGQLLLEHNHPGAWFRRFLSKHVTAIYSAGVMALIAVERLTFKVMVDRMAPFRFVLAQVVALCYAVAVGVVVLRRMNAPSGRGGMEGFPISALAVMAVLDMLHLVLMIVAAADVAPTLTVLLLQCSAPLCLAVAGVFCKRRHPDRSVIGGGIIFLGALVAMYPSLVRLIQAQGALHDDARNHDYDADHLRGDSGDYAIVEGYNTILYVLACVPAAISTVYKQHSLEKHGRPVDAHQLGLGVTAFEVVFIALAAPMAYRLQDLGRHGNGSSHVGQALRDGWRCLLFMRDVKDVDGYPVDAECWGGLPLVLLYVVATLLVNTLVQKVVDSAETPSVYHRAMALSVPTAFAVLCLYDPQVWLHDSLNVFTLAALVVIMIGLRFYYSVADPDDPRDDFDPPSPPAGKRYG